MKHRSLLLALCLCVALWSTARATDYTSYYEQLPVAVAQPELPQVPERTVRLTDFGAKGDGLTLNTDAFRQAIASLSRRLRVGYASIRGAVVEIRAFAHLASNGKKPGHCLVAEMWGRMCKTWAGKGKTGASAEGVWEANPPYNPTMCNGVQIFSSTLCKRLSRVSFILYLNASSSSNSKKNYL
jgi:hypothetical protein